MDLTQKTDEQKNIGAKKMMLWFGIISLVMAFAGWTSAYIVRRKGDDWLNEVQLPEMFIYSTIVIILSSLFYILARRELQKGGHYRTTIFLFAALISGFTFIVFQFLGFNEMIAVHGYRFTGPTSNIKMSFVYLIAFVHILHVVAGVISLLVVLNNQYKRRYTKESMLGFELGATFWHFLGILWVYLVLFMYFVQ